MVKKSRRKLIKKNNRKHSRKYMRGRGLTGQTQQITNNENRDESHFSDLNDDDSRGSLHLSDLNGDDSRGSLHLSELNDDNQGEMRLSDLDLDDDHSEGSLHLSDLDVSQYSDDGYTTDEDRLSGGRKKRRTMKKRKGRKTHKKQGGKHRRKTRRQRGGKCYGNGVGANNNDPNFSIYNTRELHLFPYRPSN